MKRIGIIVIIPGLFAAGVLAQDASRSSFNNVSTGDRGNETAIFYLDENGGTFLLDSIIGYDFDEHVDSILYSRQINNYDANGNLTLSTSYRWRSNHWAVTDIDEYSYDANSNLVVWTNHWYFRWEEGLEKYEYSYDVYGNQTSEVRYEGDSVIYKWEYSYDPNNHKTLDIYYHWDSDNNDWIVHYKREHNYDANGNETLLLRYYWDFDNNNWVESHKYEYSYDTNNNRTLEVSSQWNNDINGWDVDKYEYSYDAYGNRKLEVYYQWHSTHWDEIYKWEHSYDTNRIQTLEVRYYWNSDLNDWVLNKKYFYYNHQSNTAIETQDGWEQMKPMKVATGVSISCVMDSLIYIIGGQDAVPQSLNSTVVYNTKTDTWSDLAPAPDHLTGQSAGVINDKIYLKTEWKKGSSRWITSDSTFAYNPAEDSWESKERCPKKGGGHAVCTLNNKLYLTGGEKDVLTGDISGQNEVFVYDPETDTWDSIPNMLYERCSHYAIVYENQLYAFGGGVHYINDNQLAQKVIGKAEKYDPIENKWTELADLPVPVAHSVIVEYDNKLYIFGGVDSHSLTYAPCTDVIQEYNPSTNEWRLMHPMPFDRAGMVGQKVDNYMYLIGGYQGNAREFGLVLDEVWKFNLDSLKPFTYVTDVSLDKDSMDLKVGETRQLVATVLPQNASDASISWSSADRAIASVNDDGSVEGKAVGVTEIYVTTSDGQFKDTCQVRVIQGVGITETNTERWLIFPNPTNGFLIIQGEYHGIHSVEVLSINGQLLYRKYMEGENFEIDLSSFRKGVYLITIRSMNFVTTRKVVKL